LARLGSVDLFGHLGFEWHFDQPIQSIIADSDSNADKSIDLPS